MAYKLLDKDDSASLRNSKLILPRKTAFWAGFFYILSFVSIPTLFLYIPIHNPTFLRTKANINDVVIGGILEIIVALSCIVTSVILYNVLKNQNQTLAIGLIASRILEAATIFVGVSFLLASVSLHKIGANDTYIPIAHTLAILYDNIFTLGQGFMPAINDILLGVLLYKSRTVPRGLAVIGIVGGFPLIIGFIAIMFGIIERTSILAGLSALMVAVFEFFLGIYFLIISIRKSSIN